MNNKQTRKLRKSIRESLQNNNMSPERYSEVFRQIYKKAKREFANTPWNEKNIIKIS